MSHTPIMNHTNLTVFAFKTETAAEVVSRAVAEGWTLNAHSNPVDDGCQDADIDLAIEYADEDMGLVYLPRDPARQQTA